MNTILLNQNQKCIDACSKCLQACYECMMACLNEPDVEERRHCIAMLMECTMICQQAIAYMSMNAIFTKDICKLCATICKKCAQECNNFKDQHCKECADICEMCSDECMQMAG